MKSITSKKTQIKTFQTKLLKYNKPPVNIILGLVTSFFLGITLPLYGVLAIKCIFSVMVPDEGLTATESVQKYVLMMIGLSCYYVIMKTLNATSFAYVAENITLGVRKDLY